MKKKNTKSKVKLMCPIRDWASLEACKDYADEVYFSLDVLSLRANTNCLKLKDLQKFNDKAHQYGLKTFLVVNSVMYNDDLVMAEKIIKKTKEVGVDSVIIWDLAAVELARKHKMPFTISTQANISNWKTAEFYQKLGAKRVVLAREMTLDQIKKLRKKIKIEVETFIHGAMCVSISGRCLLSAYLYGKSANCGACGQPCRKLWTLQDEEGNKLETEGKYFLSAKDMCMIEFIPELIEAGIDSFKIEGRRRDPRYIETVSRAYREVINAYYDGIFSRKRAQELKEEMTKVYYRGFSTGFYFGTPSKEGINYDKADNISTVKKVLVGKVSHYYPKVKVALIKLYHRGIKKGDELSFEGDKSYLRQKALSIEIENTPVNNAKKGQDVGIKVEKPIKKGTNVFIYKK